MSSVTRTYFTLNVADMARALAFYREVLGPVVRYESDTWSEIKLGDATVALHAGNGPPRDSGLAVEVGDLEGACEAVRRTGGEVRDGPAPRGLAHAAEVTDTEGNAFTLVAG